MITRSFRRSLFLLFFLFLFTFSSFALFTPDKVAAPTSGERIVYGKSGADRDLVAYRFGEGKNVMVLGFAMHGFEDTWLHDGEALVYTADLLMEELDAHPDQVNHAGWSVYVLPCMNPDGLIDGNSCYGPGRCTTTYLTADGKLSKSRGIDINRSFPVNWIPFSSYRNYNGPAPLASRESKALADFIESVRGNQVNLCIDVHGWYTQTVTSNGPNSLLFETFQKEFPLNTWSNTNSGIGYFTAYAASLGYTSCIFEFPWGNRNMSSFQKSGHPEAFCRCVLELLEVYGSTSSHDCISTQFRDVSLNAWYHQAIDYVVEESILIGTSKDTFSPKEDLSRAMLVSVLWRLAGEPAATNKDISFPDVKPEQWYTEAVCWARENDIVLGYDDGSFGTNDPVTRQDLAVILHRFAGYQNRDTSVSLSLEDFTDHEKVGSYAEEAMEWACGEGLIQGTNETTLSPRLTATRAQASAILMRYHKQSTTFARNLYLPDIPAQVEPIYYDDSPDPGGN